MTAPTARVIIADDEPLARRRMQALLAPYAGEFAVIAECADGPSTLSAIRETGADVIFLDIEMPELDGFAVLREVGAALPLVVFVTAHDRYAVDAFDAQAIDYLRKPCDEARFSRAIERVREQLAAARTRDAHERLLSLVRSLDTSSAEEPPRRLRTADIELDVAARKVWRAGQQVVLRRREFDVLQRLVLRAGQVVARNELLQEIWGYQSDVVSRTVDTHVFELRRKLGHAPAEDGYIETIARVGYRLRTDGAARSVS